MDKRQQEKRDGVAAKILQALLYQREQGTGGLSNNEGDDMLQADEPIENVDALLDDFCWNVPSRASDVQTASPQRKEGLGGFAQTREDDEVHFEHDPQTFRQILGDVKKTKLCQHCRNKYRCKECGGSQICPHGRRKYPCKDCGGSQICQHGGIKSQCKDC